MSEAEVESTTQQEQSVNGEAPAASPSSVSSRPDSDGKRADSPSAEGSPTASNPDEPPKKQKLREIVQMSGGAVKCVECETRSYPAETIYFDKLPYHRDCFKCTNCKEKIPNLSSAQGFEQDLYCNRCYNNLGLRQKQLSQAKWVPKTTTTTSTATATMRFGGGGTPCTACTKTCYPAEGVLFEKQLYHKDCIICSDCKTKCTVVNANRFEENIFCTSCWERGGYSRKQVENRGHKPSASGNYNPNSMRFGGGGVPCTGCSKTVYPAESVSFQSQPYHSHCLSCSNCNTGCTVNNINQFEGKLYCTGCWDKGGYALKQRDARGHGPSPSSPTASNPNASRFGGGGVPCTSCAKTVYPAESVSFQSQPYHSNCLVCSTCSTGCTVNNINQFEGKLYCTGCWDKGGYAAKQRDTLKSTSATTTTTTTKPTPNPIAARFGGGGTKCTTCEKTCYPAETITYDKLPYHRDCLQCTECNLKCTLTNANKFDGKILCKSCWEKGGYAMKQTQIKWEKKEDGSGSGSGSTTGSSRFATLGGGGTKCTTCNKTVYTAECVTYESLPYHRLCFTCTNCACKLEAVSAQHKDKKPYCAKCFQDLGLWRADA